MESNKKFAIIVSVLLLVGLFALVSADIYGGFAHDDHDHEAGHHGEDHHDEEDHEAGHHGEGSNNTSNAAIYAILSAVAVSLVALSGLMFFPFSDFFSHYLPRVISFAIGALLGGAFLHLLPHLLELENGLSINTSLMILFGFVSMFILENLIGHTHSHPADHLDSSHVHDDPQIKPSAFLISFGDGIHNLLDGLIIGAVYLVSIPSGIAITLATFLHEIPMELADYGILLNSGLAKRQALLVNLITGMATILGVVIALYLTAFAPGLTKTLFAIGVGNFIYIASAALLPDLLREENWNDNIFNLLSIVLGIGIMLVLVLFE